MSRIRVMVHDAWDEVTVDSQPGATLANLKADLLDAARVRADPADFVLKWRGAELADESATIASLGLPDDAALILLRRRRRAVR
ncbi:MAG TPA: hypothetical protein PLL69_10065 [Gemmatimonadales bacterium]|nr:hypothetical protein [Gemmatimonadales bacterium]